MPITPDEIVRDDGDPSIIRSSLSSRYWRNLESYPGQIFGIPDVLSAKQETIIGRDHAVRAGRAAERGVEHIRGGIEAKTDMVTGPRLFVQPAPDWDIITGFTDEEKRTFVNQSAAWFNNWAYDTGFYADAEGHGDFGHLMWLAYRGVASAEAECLGIIHYDEERMIELGCNWATTVQLVAPRRLKTPPMLATDPNVFSGKKLDRFGRAIGFWFEAREQGDPGWTGALDDYEYAPRQTETGRPFAFHYFEKDQPHAQRGMTTLVTILGRTGPVDTYYRAHIAAAVTRAIFAFYAKTLGDKETLAEELAPAADTGVSAFERKIDFYKNARIRIGKPDGSTARVSVLPPGDELKFENMEGMLGDPAPLVNLFLREYASATGTTFGQVSKNFSDDSYMSARAAILDVWRGVVTRRTFFASAVPSPIFGAVIEEAIERKRVILPAKAPPFREFRAAYCRCWWTGPAMPEVDPLKAAQASEIRLRTRVSNRQLECADRGLFYFDVLTQFATEIREVGELAEENDIEFELEPKKPGQAEGGDQPGEAGDGNTEDQADAGGKRKKEKKAASAEA